MFQRRQPDPLVPPASERNLRFWYICNTFSLVPAVYPYSTLIGLNYYRRATLLLGTFETCRRVSMTDHPKEPQGLPVKVIRTCSSPHSLRPDEMFSIIMLAFCRALISPYRAALM